MAPQLARRKALRDQPGDAAAGDAVGVVELDTGAVLANLAQPPASSLVDAGDRVERHVSGRLPLDDLDQAADVGGADADQDPVAGAEPVTALALDLPPREADHEVRVV